MAVASLAVTKTYADGLAWTEARMDTSMQSIQTYTQTSLVNNFNQIAKDAFGTSYSYDNDGNANLATPFYTSASRFFRNSFGQVWPPTTAKTNTLYNKQTLVSSNASIVALATGANSWTTTTTALNLAFTPEATGKYEIKYNFTHSCGILNGGDCKTLFAIYNQTGAATLVGVESQINMAQFTSEDLTFGHPVSLSYIHTFSSTAAATFLLRYRVTTAASLNFNRLSYSATIGRSQYGSIQKI